MECPACGSRSVSSYPTEHSDGKYIHYTCNKCKTEWETPC